MKRLIWLFRFLFFFLQYQSACSSPLSSSPSSIHLCPLDERTSLLQFKQMFTINNSVSSQCDGYAKTLSWNETTDCCSWDGVTCDESTGHVTKLDLSCSKLYGTIHPDTTLFQLSHLQQLNLAFNHFNFSHIPPSFSCFTSLSHLNLSCSSLSGTIPSEIGHLSKLVSLDLSYSSLSGTIPSEIGHLSKLVSLDLSYSSLSGSIPLEIGHLSKLVSLDLSYSSLSGSIPTEIAHLSKLVSLDLSTNPTNRGSILRLEPHNFEMLLKNLTQLQDLVLYQVNISSRLPHSLLNLSSLATIDLTGTGLLGELPNEIFQLPKLQKLYLGGNYNMTGNLLKVKWGCNSSLEKLVLSGALMSGKLPDSIGYLRFLNYLDLAGNQFSGPLPESLGNLTRITTLILYKNGFTGRFPGQGNNRNGEIPDFFAKLLKLEYLILGSNNFAGPFPSWVANLTQLFQLDISNTALTGPIPSNITGFRKLNVLFLSNSSLNGTLPLWLFTMPSLKELNLNSNQLTGQIPEFGSDSPLLAIDLSYNKLHGPIPQSISGLGNWNWSRLELQSNNLSGDVELQIFSNLWALDLSKNNLFVRIGSNANASWPNLSSLRLSSCNITEFPDFLQNSKNLGTVDLSNNKIHGQIPKWIERASFNFLDLSHNYLQGPLLVPSSFMSYFLVSHNKLTGEIPSSICNMSSLVILVLSNNSFTGVIPQCLGNVNKGLEVLDLRMNGFHGAIPTTFAKSNKLRSLNLNGNHLQGSVPRSLANCRTMEVLDIGNNNLNGAFPHWLESLPELQVLVLKSNRFHGPIGTSRTETPFPNLRILDLSHNNFTGLLPERYFLSFKAMMNSDESTMSLQYMGDDIYRDSVELVLKGVEIEMKRILTVFTTIDFSSNNFRGEIPNDIGKLKGLRLLNLSQNSLSGHLPSLLGNITKLESLDLSSNLLTGQIPGELKSLTFLAVLNLSKNHLVGPIPQGNQFNTFSNDSYVGNSGLCGLPLSKKCGDREAEEQPISQDGDDDDDFMAGFTWRIVLIGYGCGFLIGATMGFAMFLIGRPRWFTRILGEEPRRKVVRISQIGWRRSH